MPVTLQSKRLKDALQKATKVGRIEDSVTIAGCPIVMQNLSPEDYSAISDEIEEVSETRLPFHYQLAHVARSIVEIDGEDLRDVTYVEDEVPSGQYLVSFVTKTENAAKAAAEKLKELSIRPTITPPEDGAVRTIKVEKHTWLANNILSTWPKETLSVAWRKLTEVLVKAEEHAKAGIVFERPEKSGEERLRKAIHDLQDAWEDMPSEFADRILLESNLLRKSTNEELEGIDRDLSTTKVVAPVVASAEGIHDETEAPRPRPSISAAEQQQYMAERQPMNQQYTNIPQPKAADAAVPARSRTAVSDAIRQSALQNTQGVNSSMVEEVDRALTLPLSNTLPQPEYTAAALKRSQEIASMEGYDYEPPPGSPQHGRNPVPDAPPVKGQIDSKAFANIVEKAPVVGLNPKFRPPNR